MKFKIGDKVKVVKKVSTNNCGWVSRQMDKYIGEIFIIDYITPQGNCKLKKIRWIFPPQSLNKCIAKNIQLLFDFMD